jgi:hypothetical protein
VVSRAANNGLSVAAVMEDYELVAIKRYEAASLRLKTIG